MEKQSILVIDDEKSCRDILKISLRINGYNVITMDDGISAWEHLSNTPPHYDVIIMDVMMPGISGIELSEKIRSNTQLQSTPIILQTGIATTEELTDALSKPGTYYLQKPYDREKLITTINEVLLAHQAA